MHERGRDWKRRWYNNGGSSLLYRDDDIFHGTGSLHHRYGEDTYVSNLLFSISFLSSSRWGILFIIIIYLFIVISILQRGVLLSGLLRARALLRWELEESDFLAPLRSRILRIGCTLFFCTVQVRFIYCNSIFKIRPHFWSFIDLGSRCQARGEFVFFSSFVLRPYSVDICLTDRSRAHWTREVGRSEFIIGMLWFEGVIRETRRGELFFLSVMEIWFGWGRNRTSSFVSHLWSSEINATVVWWLIWCGTLLRYWTPYELDPFSCLQALDRVPNKDVFRFSSPQMVPKNYTKNLIVIGSSIRERKNMGNDILRTQWYNCWDKKRSRRK